MTKKKKSTAIIAFANNKGGSGKSTTCSSVGYAMSTLGQRVLLIDGDGQMNLTLSLFPEEQALGLVSGAKNLYSVLCGTPAADCIIPTPYEGLDMIVASPRLAMVDRELSVAEQKEKVLKKALDGIKNASQYDAILIDAPPALGIWTENILTASTALIVPVEASPWGLFGLANMLESYSHAASVSDTLSFAGVVVTKVNQRKSYARQTIDTLKEIEGIHLFDTYIHTDSSVEWAQEASVPVMKYKKTSRSAVEYMTLTKEIMKVCQ